MTHEVKPQDEHSSLVERSWVRRGKRHGELTEWTLEGEEVEARFLDDQGGAHHVRGKVVRNAAGELTVESWAQGVKTETAVPRDASVDIAGGRR